MVVVFVIFVVVCGGGAFGCWREKKKKEEESGHILDPSRSLRSSPMRLLGLGEVSECRVDASLDLAVADNKARQLIP